MTRYEGLAALLLDGETFSVYAELEKGDRTWGGVLHIPAYAAVIQARAVESDETYIRMPSGSIGVLAGIYSIPAGLEVLGSGIPPF